MEIASTVIYKDEDRPEPPGNREPMNTEQIKATIEGVTD